MHKNKIRFLAFSCATMLMLSACSTNAPTLTLDPTLIPEERTPVVEAWIDGTYTAAFPGFGGDVSATLVIANGAISSLKVDGSGETVGIGSNALDTINETMLNHVGKTISEIADVTVDAISGATITVDASANAISTVLRNAASGTDASEVASVADGSYIVEVPAHSPAQKMTVEVTFAGGNISDIKVLEHGETQPIFDTVTELMIPRMLDAQSLAVDSITGATVSSVAVKAAVAAAIEQAGGETSAWFAPIEKSSEVVRLEGYDVIVVGLGGAGIASYISAAENGATVFGIESAGKVGGTSSNVSGPMAINPPNRVANENDGQLWLDPEELIADWLDYTRGDAKADLVRLFVEESGPTMDWLMEDYEFAFSDMSAFFHPRMWVVWARYDGDRDAMFGGAMNAAKAMNSKNDYMTELTGNELIVENNEVVGVRATYFDGTTYEVYGDSVILATGGFLGNAQMSTEHLGAAFRAEAMMQNNGAGINMGLSVGAGTYNIDMPAMVHIAQVKNIIRSDELTADQKAVLSAMVLKPDTMIVGTDGNRFMSEAGNLAFDNWKGGGFYHAIYSDDQIKQYTENGMDMVASPMFMNQGGTIEAGVPIADMEEILTVGEQFGNVVRADTLEELATKLNAPGLVEAVQQYNQIAAGEMDDPFAKDPALIRSLENGPFTAVLGAGYYYGTCGGLDIDASMNVLRADGSVIENLYAVGQESMGVLFTNKDAYVTYGGAAQGWVLTSGRLAGANAAAIFAD